MRLFLSILVAVTFVAACSNSNQSNTPAVPKADENQIVITNDMENAAAMIPSWINEAVVVKMENGTAHSGEFVARVDDQNLYTYAFMESFENINQKLPKRVVMNGWVNSPDPSPELGLIMDISEDNVMKIWKSYSLTKTVEKPNQWFEFTAYFPIDQQIQPNYKVKLFGYSGKKLAYFDDFKITFEY